MFSRKVVAVIAFISLTVSVVIACGPNFPWQLLDDRPATFKAAPANSFIFEAARIAPPPTDKLKAIETDDPDALTKAESIGLSTEQGATLQQMRKQVSGDQAFQLGGGLPLSVRLYTTGAIDFRQHEMGKAEQRFAAVLQLLPNDRMRAIWAAYMIGRIAAFAGDSDKATRAFAQTRDLAIKGAPDPLGLAVASYGEEARLHLTRAQSYLSGPQKQLPKERSDDYGREIAAAVEFYAEQAARESSSGVSSLRQVAEQLMQNNGPSPEYETLVAAIGSPAVQRLVAASGPPYFQYGDLGLPFRHVPSFEHAVWADQPAAAAYAAGSYQLAQKLATQTPSPLASWVKAKLALQKDDLKAAAAFYAEASRSFPPAELKQNLDDHNQALLVGESGALALARGEYVEALKYLYPVANTYWGDAAYTAERVLTVDELKHFVDASVVAPIIAPSNSGSSSDQAADPAASLRDLLARRLVREGRYHEALAYFHSASDTHFEDPNVRLHVTAYARAVNQGRGAWRRSNRARSFYQAAVLAHNFGMGMMGYETEPDYFVNGGGLAGGYGQDNPGRCFVTDGELARFDASKPKVDLRLHYRFVAVDEAVQAADLLPPRSQAFAAVLCQATDWMLLTEGIDGDKEVADLRVDQLYHRYLKEGPHVAWAAHFGRDCPEPDFGSAARLPRVLFVRHTRHFVARHRWPLGLSFGSLLIAIGGGFIWMRRRAT
jgi:tetratricopeptide (TPR) repeat protein